MVIHPIALLALVLLVTLPLRSGAQTSDAAAAPAPAAPEQARALFLAGVAKAQAEQWQAAEHDFRASYALVARPSTLYNLALVLYRQGDYQESAELCDSLLGSPDAAAQVAYKDRARTLLARVRAEAATVSVIVVPDGAAWTIDGHDMAARGARRQVLVAAGQHVFEFSAAGFESRRVELAVAQGDRHTLTVDLSAVAAPVVAPSLALGEAHRVAAAERARSAIVPPVPPAASTSNRMPQWLLLATGGALLSGAVVTGVMALNADAEFEEKCPQLRNCDSSLASLQERTETLSTATDVLLVAGGLVMGGAVVWLLVTGEAEPNRSDSAMMHPTVRGMTVTLGSGF